MAINHLLRHGNGNPSSADVVIHYAQWLFTNLETHQGGPKHHNRVKTRSISMVSKPFASEFFVVKSAQAVTLSIIVLMVIF